MSGRESSQRLWVSGRVRALLAVLMALSMLVTLVISAYAAGNGGAATAAQEPVATDTICVKGSVINFDETPLGDPDYWTIRYAPYVNGELDEATEIRTDANGEFKVESGLSVGLWNFEIVIDPNSGWEGVTPTFFDVPLSYGRDKCVEIRFKLRRPVPVIVTKIDDDHNPLSGWVIRAEPGRGNWFATPVEKTTDNNGEAIFRLTEGPWVFKEKAPSGVHYSPVIPTTGVQTLDVEWQGIGSDGKPIPQYLRFKNRVVIKGCIDVFKLDVPPNNTASTPLPGWKILVKRANGSVAASGYTDANGSVRFENLWPGPYTVVEERRPGWAPVTPTGYTVNVAGGEDCQTVTFFNEQDAGYCIVGRKIDTNGKVGIPGWKITVTPLDKGGALPTNGTEDNGSAYVYTDGLGQYKFEFPRNDYRVPNALYKVCEEQKAGWLPHTSLCYTVRLPHEPGACVKTWDFENQQVGHWESVVYGRPSSSTSCNYTHTVQPGESLCGIGSAYGVSCSSMFSANPWVYNQPNHYVYTGQQVCVP